MPIHPLKLLYPLLDTVFHVTNSGYSSVLFRRLLANEKREDRDLIELVELAGVSVPEPLFWMDEVVDRVDGRLLDELEALASRFRSLEIAAGRAVGGSSASAISASSSSCSSSEGLSSSSVTSSPLLMRCCCHSSLSWAKPSGWRCSKLAERHSKQKAQCAWVAIDLVTFTELSGRA